MIVIKWIYEGKPQELKEFAKDSEVENLEIDIIDITDEDLSGFIRYCTEILDNGSDAVKYKVAALKSFYRYFSATNCRLLDSPAKLLELPKCERKMPNYLTDAELYRLKKASFYGEMPERNQSMITLLVSCGLRIGELVKLNISDINEDKLCIHGEKARDIILTQTAKDAIDAWLKVRGDYYCIDDEALFISDQKGKRLTERSVQKIIDKVFNKAGLNKDEYSAHTLRHTAAINMIKNGASDKTEVSKFMGNIAPKTIDIYKTALEKEHA